MRGSGSYFPLSALPAFHSFQISHIINRNVLKESHCYSFLSSSDLSTVCFAVFNGGQGRTCERYILWSVVMPSTPVYAICMHCTCTHIMFWHYAGYLCLPFLSKIQIKLIVLNCVQRSIHTYPSVPSVCKKAAKSTEELILGVDFIEGLKILVIGTLDMIGTCHALKNLYLLNRQY